MDFLNSVATITVCRLNSYLLTNGNSSILSDIAERFEKLDVSELYEYANDDLKTMSESKKRYLHIVELFKEGYRTIVEDILDFSIMMLYRPEAFDILKKNGVRLSVYEILRMHDLDVFDYGQVALLVEQLKTMFYMDNTPSLTSMEFTPDSRLINYLALNDTYDIGVRDVCYNFTDSHALHALVVNTPIYEHMNRIIDSRGSLMHIRGSSLSGKKFLLKHSARTKHREILFADFALLMRYTSENLRDALWQIRREAMLYDRMVCWYNVSSKGISKHNWEVVEFLRFFVYNYIEQGVQVCICSDDSTDFSSYCNYPVNMVSIPDTNESQRIEGWKYFSELYGFTSLPYMDFAMRYKLSIGKISEIFKKKSECFFGDELSENAVFERLCSETWNINKDLLKLKTSNYTFSDLKLPKAQLRTFKQICENFSNSYKVYNEWGMRQKFPYGRGISVLLTGPPGTGKTMSACVIANEINLPLYQADMSQVFDKYIGETEKNIDAIFNEAEKQNCILFLDEADSLCGKRSEINDSKDKYSNNDTAFLLQRIENYDGIVILATNYINNIDNAFMRRMKYVVPFSIPDKSIRLEIWKSSFTELVAISSDVDFEYLAEQFEFSGSNIKNIVLSAVFLSASEGVPVSMHHIIRSIYTESQKQQRHLFANEFGKYSDLFNEINLY